MRYFAILDWMDHDDGQLVGEYPTWYQAARAAITAQHECTSSFPLAGVRMVDE